MIILLFHLVNLILDLVFIVLYPLLYLVLWSQHYQQAMDAKAPDSKGGILIHAASVGEVNAAKPLILALQQRYPGKTIVLTTTTTAGLKVAKSMGLPARLAVLDFPTLRARQLRAINPALIIIMETELWFNLLYQAKKQHIYVVFVNARLSEKSLKRYSMIKGLLRYLQKPIKGIYAQSEADARRFRSLFEVPVHCLGNLKYSLKPPTYNALATRQAWGYADTDFILCMGSSRPGEEALLQSILPLLKQKIPKLKVIIAIRHTKRSAEVQSLFTDHRLFSESKDTPLPAADVLIVDTIGHLNECYAICDIALVGGSFYNFGGHNPLEPAYYGKAIIMGEFHHSCAESVHNLQKHDAIVISAPEDLARDIIALYSDVERREKLGQNAKNSLRLYDGYLEEYLKGLQQWLK